MYLRVLAPLLLAILTAVVHARVSTHIRSESAPVAPSIDTASNNTFSFIVVGDWGGSSSGPNYTTPREDKVAVAMGTVAAQVQSQFVIGAGDNFYEEGIQGDEFSPRFNATFENVYTAPGLQTPWYLIAGNHDHKGNVSAEIAYTAHSKRWHYPSYWYSVNQQLPGNQTALFVYIDTVILTGVTMDDKDPEGTPIQHELRVKGTEQLEWLKTTLSNSTADWIFVTGHYPVWSIAEHGPTAYMVAFIAPLFDKYGVAGYFCGHEHDMQHLQGKSVDYYLSGAGDKCEFSDKHKWEVPPGVSKFQWPSKHTQITDTTGGFVAASISGDTLEVKYYDQDAKVLYTTSKQNPRKQPSA